MQVGQKYNSWIVISESFKENNRNYTTAICKCGHIQKIRIESKNKLQSKMCKICASTKHGLHKTLEYKTWHNLRSRCNTKSDKSYMEYGGRGIKVCDRWDDFKNFLKDMGQKPSKNHQIDRIDSNGDYQPDNCRWVLPDANCKNTRKSKRWYVNGIKFNSLTEAAKHFNKKSHNTIVKWCEGFKRNGIFYPPKENCWSEKLY